MLTQITITDGKISVNGIDLVILLDQVYNKGKADAGEESKVDKVTFLSLANELQAQGRKITARTLINRAREANVKVFRFDGNKLACRRSDIKHIVSI